MSDIKTFIDSITAYIDSGKVNLPVFNPTALRVQQELIRKEPDMQVVEKLIIRDQTLSTEVLRLANSSFYQGLVEIKSVKAAIVRLGMREVGRIVLLAASKKQFVLTDKYLNILLKRLWQHSAGVGLAANWIAKKCNFGEIAGQSFFAGLLHDIGKLFLLTVIEQSNMRKSGKMTGALLMEVIDTLHTKQGYALMKRWNIPQGYCDIVRDHHEPVVDIKDTLLIIVRLADMVCHKLSIGLHHEPDLALASTPEANMLELSEIDLAELEIMLEDTRSLVG